MFGSINSKESKFNKAPQFSFASSHTFREKGVRNSYQEDYNKLYPEEAQFSKANYMKSARNLKMTEGDIILSNRTMGNSKSNATLNTSRLAKTNMMFYRTNGL